MPSTTQGRLLKTIDPLGRIERWEYAEGLNPLPLAHVDARGGRRTMTWNRLGLLTSSTDCSSKTTRCEHDMDGHVAARTNALDETVRYLRLRTGEPVDVTLPDGQTEHFEYDAAGLLRLHRNPIGQTRRWTRNARGQVTQAVDAADRSLIYRYDAHGRLTELSSANGARYRFAYDAAGRLLAEHGADGNVNYELDELDQLTTLALPHGQRIDTLSYGSGHVHQIRSGEHIVADFERDDLHREVLRTQGELTQRVGYDPLGRRTWQSAGTANDVLGPGQGRLWRSYRYDLAGELAEQRDNLRGATIYDYDPAGQLLRATREVDRTQEQFAWDAAGNLLDAVSRKSAGSIVGNRLHVWQDIRFIYDAWGNVATKRRGTNQTQTFRFDADNRLIVVSTQGARGTIETRFEYDALGRRIARHETQTEASGGAPHHDERRFVWQGLRLAQEFATAASARTSTARRRPTRRSRGWTRAYPRKPPPRTSPTWPSVLPPSHRPASSTSTPTSSARRSKSPTNRANSPGRAATRHGTRSSVEKTRHCYLASSSHCGIPGNTRTTRRGCTTTRSAITTRTLGGSSIRIRLGWRVARISMHMHRILPAGLIRWAGAVSGHPTPIIPSTVLIYQNH